MRACSQLDRLRLNRHQNSTHHRSGDRDTRGRGLASLVLHLGANRGSTPSQPLPDSTWRSCPSTLLDARRASGGLVVKLCGVSTRYRAVLMLASLGMDATWTNASVAGVWSSLSGYAESSDNMKNHERPDGSVMTASLEGSLLAAVRCPRFHGLGSEVFYPCQAVLVSV